MISKKNILPSPDILYGQLYFDIQLARVYSEGETFTDSVPDASPSEEHFHLQTFPDLIYTTDTSVDGSSTISLPFPYIVPGGRYRAMFYWDSYFTMLGLMVVPDRIDMIKSMIDNFAYMIDLLGFIPNANRTYFSGVYPLYFKLATPEQAARVHEHLGKSFLRTGGLTTSLEATGEQWN
ncbi:unnamed protein product [Rotaria magnacalcarata]